MKTDLHPKEYRLVVFKDVINGEMFLSRSCAHSKESVVWEDGKQYPLYLMGISSATHPFYTGKQTFVDTAGRVDKYQQRLAKTEAAKASAAAKTTKKRQ
ncbi:MAG: type B 50S ribosomal protein L31 [Pedosphaera sp.]|nr:type B 50S ribosomal protein L31 [Pedosphaera sp.]